MNNLIVPVYLNQKLVFDLLAMLEGGIATVTGITRTNEDVDTSESNGRAGFGLGEALSMLMRVDLSGEKKSVKSTQSGETQSEERVHTPASLLFQLRNTLEERDMLVADAVNELPPPGAFVEFEGALKRNPIVEVLDSFSEMMALAETFDDSSSSGHKPAGGSGKKKVAPKSQESEYSAVKRQMERLSESIKAGESIDLTAPNIRDSYSAVITLETSYLNDPGMADVVDGQFRVLGKVVRRVHDESESISLLRKTAISKMPPKQLESIFGELQSLSTTEDFDLPQISWDVHGPAIQVIPIAIYA